MLQCPHGGTVGVSATQWEVRQGGSQGAEEAMKARAARLDKKKR